MNETYQEYINRVAQLTLPGACSSQLQTIQSSPKFTEGKANYFPGYSVITPPYQEDSENEEFYSQIELLQKNIIQQLEPKLVVPLTARSFHFTIADLVWGESYEQIVKDNPQFEAQLQENIEHSFAQYQEISDERITVQWQLLGIAIRPRAIMACLVPKDQASYQAILDLRRCIYQNSGLIGLGIEQQYDFTAHITLAYFDQIKENLNRSEICVIISQIGDRLLENNPVILTVKEGELRKFENMLDYHRQPDWAKIDLSS